MQLYNNIDLVQIDIKAGTEEYYLPKNVNWRERVIDKIVLALAPAGVTTLSPIDGQTVVLEHAQVSDLYFDLYAADDTQIARNLYFEELLHTNNHVQPVGVQLSLNLSRLYFTTAPQTDGCILLYVFYGTKEADYTPTQKSVTVDVELPANARMSLQDIVDNYIMLQPETLKGMYVWDAAQTPVYATLRDKDGKRSLNYIFCSLCRPPIIYTAGQAGDTQLHELRFDGLNIDMLNSYIQNGQNSDVAARISFNY